MEEGDELELVGVVRAMEQPLRAPLTGQPCVAYMTHARVWSRLDWMGVLESELAVAAGVVFALDTPDGEIVVDAEHGTVAGHAQQFVPPHDPRMQAFLAPRGLAHLVGSTFAEHWLVAPGDRVRIRGIAMRERALVGGEHGYRDEAVRFKLVGYPQRPLIIQVVQRP